MDVGKRVMELRSECGYSRVAFADKLGIPHTTLRNYELGTREPGHAFLIKVAREFDVSVDYLLGLTTERYALRKSNSFSPEAHEIARAYEAADLGTQASVRKLLDVKKPPHIPDMDKIRREAEAMASKLREPTKK